MTPRSFASVAAAVVLVPSLATAQRIDALPVAARPAPLASLVDTATAALKPPAGAAPARALMGIVGYAGGFWAGAYVGYQYRHKTGGEYEGVGEAIIGGAVGGILGSAAGAAVPELRSACDGGRRFGRAIAGATLGAAAGLVGLAGAWVVALTVPVGTVVGATIGAHNCRPGVTRST